MPTPSTTAALKQRDYFIILDKDPDHPTKPYFEFVMIDIIKDDLFYHELTYKDVPFFQGVAQFEINEATNHYLPFRVWKRVKDPKTKEEVLNFIDPTNFRTFLINAKFVVIGNHLNQPQGHQLENWQIVDTDADEVQTSQMDVYMKQLAPIYDYVEVLQYTNIRNYLFCHHCKMQRKFTLLDSTTRFRSQAFFICKSCAGSEILQLLKTRMEITPQLKIYIRDLLLKYNDVNKVMNVFSPNFNILAHPEATLVSITKAQLDPSLDKKVAITDVEIPFPLIVHYLQQGKTHLLPAQVMAMDAGLIEGQNQLIVSATSSGKTMIGELTGLSKILNDKFTIAQKQGCFSPFSEKLASELKMVEENSEEFSFQTDYKFSELEQSYLATLLTIQSTKKMLYLVPIVALANMRLGEYQDLKKIGIRTALRIGVSYMNPRRKNTEDFGKMSNADIIIGTYEALDILLRSGHANLLHNISTIVIDEIQMLADQERGFVLDGLIGRLHMVLPRAQYLYLSATISDPESLATHFRAALIQYEERPVPIERHLVVCMDDGIRLKNIATLVREEFKKRSSFGFLGQTIIFTNSRKNTERLAEYLRKNHITAMAYHAGLTYDGRKMVERNFAKQKIMAVVTTAALAAGVDFPASQVIFASLMMGIKWLTVAEFEQMAGRAGRYKKHDLGRVFLLVTPGKTYSGSQSETEEQAATYVLKGKIEPLLLPSEENAHYTEVLAVIAMFTPQNASKRMISMDELFKYHAQLFNNAFDLKESVKYLREHYFIEWNKETKEIRSTSFGNAVAESFLRVDQAYEIREVLEAPIRPKEHPPRMISIAEGLVPLNNIYVTNRFLAEVTSKNQAKQQSNNFFSNSILDLITADNLARKAHIPPRVYDIILKWSEEFFNCTCTDRPYCDCARKNIEAMILDYRRHGLGLEEIILHLADEYELQLFYGDLVEWFEQLIHIMHSIQNIGETFPIPTPTKGKVDQISEDIELLIHASADHNEISDDEEES